MSEPHIEVIMNLTSDMFETDSNALQILPQELLDLKHLHSYKSSVNQWIVLVNSVYCLYKITWMLESEKRVEWKVLYLYPFRVMLWSSIISCTTFSLLNLPTFTGQKPQPMLLLACAHWEFPNIVKVWYFASRRAMLAFFILADGQHWATIVFDPLERKDKEQIYRGEVRTGKIMETLEHKTGHRAQIPKRVPE